MYGGYFWSQFKINEVKFKRLLLYYTTIIIRPYLKRNVKCKVIMKKKKKKLFKMQKLKVKFLIMRLKLTMAAGMRKCEHKI